MNEGVGSVGERWISVREGRGDKFLTLRYVGSGWREKGSNWEGVGRKKEVFQVLTIRRCFLSYKEIIRARETLY